MLTNYHTHTTFCDGQNTPEEVVLSAIEGGIDILGFSAHSYVDFDPKYCLRDTVGYIKEILRLSEKYKDKIEILLGIEEDVAAMCNRADLDYIIGSCHFTSKNGVLLPIDNDLDSFHECLELWDGDYIGMAEEYYSRFTEYIKKRRPDIIGHFDLITKFDDVAEISFGKIPEYNRIAEKYMIEALKAECVFEVNTGAISRGYRKTPYPCENLLYLIRKNGGRVIMSSDSHAKDTLTCAFDFTRELLKDVGFKKISILHRNGFTEENI